MSLTIAVISMIMSVAFGLIPLFLTGRFRKQVKELRSILYPRPRGRVAVILPCKGIDPGFRDNLRAFFDQDYPSLELVFSVATADDPACAEIDAVMEEYAGSVKAYRMVAGIENVRAQKITNLLSAVKWLGASANILVFADSDLRPDSGFVRRLVAPLVLPQVGATTGYRWYAPQDTRLGSILRSTWNAGALPFVSDSKHNFCFGGAMAIRKNVYDIAGIAQAWDRTLSDDLMLTVKVRGLGLETQFVLQLCGRQPRRVDFGTNNRVHQPAEPDFQDLFSAVVVGCGDRSFVGMFLCCVWIGQLVVVVHRGGNGGPGGVRLSTDDPAPMGERPVVAWRGAGDVASTVRFPCEDEMALHVRRVLGSVPQLDQHH
ncbi:MAG: glycosyltransferase [Elusimicrobia bacterium]|nr:glycosyltransferase [Elusimicrobiota bacterium]